MQQYRDLNKQNEWLRQNIVIFDVMGNYLFCASCLKGAFHLSYQQRLSRQWRIKQSQSQQLLVIMSKSQLEDERLGKYVVMPNSCDQTFKSWWMMLDPTTEVQVCFPHEKHGHAGKISNSAESSIMEDFLSFVDTNSQPNGGSSDFTGPTSYFLSKFKTIQTPKSSVNNYEECLSRSVVGEFNRAQKELGKMCVQWLST